VYELFPWAGCTGMNHPWQFKRVVKLYTGYATTERWTKEGDTGG